MPRAVAGRIVEAFDRLAIDPRGPGLDVAPLRGRPGFRLRIGGWRAIYQVEEDRLIILVLDIGPRGDVYK